MNVIIQINGREAIPVRALPWLTRDRLFSAQDVSDALSLSAEFPDFSSIHPYRFDGGIVGAESWRDEVQGKIKSLEVQKLAKEQWRLDSLAALPAGVFVWRDEWEPAYNRSPYGPDALKLLSDDDDKQDIDERTLNFAPQLPLHIPQSLVMEGFPQHEAQVQAPAPAPAQNTATPAPVVAASDSTAPLNTIVHSTKTRRNTLTPVIEQAQKQCNDPQDPAAVWAALQVLAENKTAPLIGATEDGLQYLKNGTAACFNREALRKRLGR